MFFSFDLSLSLLIYLFSDLLISITYSPSPLSPNLPSPPYALILSSHPSSLSLPLLFPSLFLLSTFSPPTNHHLTLKPPTLTQSNVNTQQITASISPHHPRQKCTIHNTSLSSPTHTLKPATRYNPLKITLDKGRTMPISKTFRCTKINTAGRRITMGFNTPPFPIED